MPWRKDTELQDLAAIDIGIMPLPNDPWARGKCGLKGLQYMALGMPTIMSPVGVNTEIIQDGVNGYLAADTDEWVRKLAALVEDADLRARMGREARRTVEERYSVMAWRDRYLTIFKTLIAERGKRSTTN
jgi:glycosyltransferase involved in cell wall biosynthesis